MKQIPLTQGKVALVDDADYDELSKYKWHAQKEYRSGTFYAARYIRLSAGKYTQISMHRQILGLEYKDGLQIDHINRNPLDNRRRFLRVCTQSKNMMNRRGKQGSSQYKGVYFDKYHKKWRAEIRLAGVGSFLGYFDFEEDAAEAYNIAAIRYFGEFACLNEIALVSC